MFLGEETHKMQEIFGSIVYLVNTSPSQGEDAQFEPAWN